MIASEPLTLVALLVWGTLVGLDLVSVAQAMLSRPLVAGAVTGLLVGDVGAGVRVGALIELFALDVLPVGAARYPDYGPPTVAATALAAGGPWELTLGLAGTLALVGAVLGGWSLQYVRRRNALAIQQAAAALAAGESRVIRRLQYAGLARDAVRSALLTGVALAGAAAAAVISLERTTAAALTVVMVGIGLAAALGGAVRGAGPGRRRAWLVGGLATGTLLAWMVVR